MFTNNLRGDRMRISRRARWWVRDETRSERQGVVFSVLLSHTSNSQASPSDHYELQRCKTAKRCRDLMEDVIMEGRKHKSRWPLLVSVFAEKLVQAALRGETIESQQRRQTCQNCKTPLSLQRIRCKTRRQFVVYVYLNWTDTRYWISASLDSGPLLCLRTPGTVSPGINGLSWKGCCGALIGIQLRATTPPSPSRTGHLFSHEASVQRSLKA
ncbi:hypothetical protein JOB18_040118 [Solea senegalensis]|uniref:Uncharacterized protein n=1 Tax=Solea senegalensis TaxID=28829 RepID=A0AAV6TAH8_SOLSE|nr:hypothetical protein JOB18_040118 [Solea senegalensis]